MKSHKAIEALKTIAAIKYANALNLSVVFSPTAKTHEGIDKNARRLIRILLKEEYIAPVLNRYHEYRHTPKQFYRPAKLGVKQFELDTKYIRFKGTIKEEHDSMKQDVLIAFYSAYKDRYHINIKHEPIIDRYQPDALIQYEDRNGNINEICFEMERKDSVADIITRKITPMMKRPYSKKVKYLIALAMTNFPPFLRHIEYNTPECNKIKGDIKKMIFRIIAKANLDDRFLFMPYYNYFKLSQNSKEAVCYDHKGNLRPLIY